MVIHSFKKYSFIREADFEYIYSTIKEALRYIKYIKKHPIDERLKFEMEKRETKDHRQYTGHDPDIFQWI